MPFYIKGWDSEVAGVEDAAAALLLAAEKGRNGERYIISDRVMTARELYETAADATGTNPPRFGVPLWVMYLFDCASDAANLVRKTRHGPDEDERAAEAHNSEIGPRQGRTRTRLAARTGPRRDQTGGRVLPGAPAKRFRQ